MTAVHLLFVMLSALLYFYFSKDNKLFPVESMQWLGPGYTVGSLVSENL